MRNKLTISAETFFDMLPKLIASGVTFEAEEVGDSIIVTFTGGF
jgi:hypothetical protein